MDALSPVSPPSLHQPNLSDFRRFLPLLDGFTHCSMEDDIVLRSLMCFRCFPPPAGLTLQSPVSLLMLPVPILTYFSIACHSFDGFTHLLYGR